MLGGWNERRVIFGAMNLWTGRRLFLPRRRQRAEDFQTFLRLLRRHYRGWHPALLLDGDPSHTARGSQELARQLGVLLLWLPKRCPELNPMDELWGQAKDAICANKQYGGIDEQVKRFIDHLVALPWWEALHTAGVHSPHFWLKSVLSKKFCGPA